MTVMKVHVTSSLTSLPILIAREKNFFKENGLKVEIFQSASFNQIEYLLLNEMTDAGELSYVNILKKADFLPLEDLNILPGFILSYLKPAIFSLYDLESSAISWNESKLIQYFMPVPKGFTIERFFSQKMANTFFKANPGLLGLPELPIQLVENNFFSKDCFGIVGDYLSYPFLTQKVKSYNKSSRFYPNTTIGFFHNRIKNNLSEIQAFHEAIKKSKDYLAKIKLGELQDLLGSFINKDFYYTHRLTDLREALNKSIKDFPQIFSTKVNQDQFTALSDLITIKETEKTFYKKKNLEFLEVMEKLCSGIKPFSTNPEEKKKQEVVQSENENQQTLTGNNTFNKNVYRLLFKESSELLLIFSDKKLQILDANAKFSQETGYNTSELKDITLYSLIPDMDENHPLNKFLKVPEESKYIANITFSHRSGNKLNFDMFLHFIEGDEEKKFISMLINNTEKKEAMRLKHEFLSNISHELRTPMTNIQGYLDLLIGDRSINFTPEHREVLNVIVKNTQRMNKLITNLLQFGKGKINVEEKVEMFDPTKIIEEVFLINQPMAKEKGLEIENSLEEGLLLEGPKNEFFHIITNLFTNAIKYTERGRVTVSCHRVENNICQIKVEDTGIGIDSKYHLSIFERFFRVPDNANRKVGGTGLGLAIAQESISKMGGVIMVDSLQGVGTTFTVMVPLAN
ncbi:MAG: PAS domain-containing protein [Leptospiraceae bacterium]|nr:PAS domain-containing protein [Leptospiraceae bacterium]